MIIRPNVQILFFHFLSFFRPLQNAANESHVWLGKASERRLATKLVKVCLFTYNHSIRSHFPCMGFSMTGGKIASVSAALIHMSHVSFVLPAQFSPLTESENGREWKLNAGPKLAHYMSIFTAFIWRAGLDDSKRGRWNRSKLHGSSVRGLIISNIPYCDDAAIEGSQQRCVM